MKTKTNFNAWHQDAAEFLYKFKPIQVPNMKEMTNPLDKQDFNLIVNITVFHLKKRVLVY